MGVYFLEIIEEREKSILVDNEDNMGTSFFLPKSQIKYDKKSKHSIKAIEIPEWLAIEKGLE